jgi:predicted Fe-Mo cluster-binding NifX family protein
MKIAISSVGEDLESQVDSRFGRCNYFLIVEVDKESKEIKNFNSVKNTAKAQAGGAGITSAQIVANERPDAVITVNTGPRAFSVFEQLGIKVYQGKGIIREVLQDLLEGKLKELTGSNGPQHMGLT